MRSTSRNQVRLGEEPRLGEWPIFSCARRMPLLFGYFEWRKELRGKKIGVKRTSIRKCSDILRASGLPAANRLALPCGGPSPTLAYHSNRAMIVLRSGCFGCARDLRSTIDECNTFRPLLPHGLKEEPVRLPWHLADCALQIALRQR